MRARRKSNTCGVIIGHGIRSEQTRTAKNVFCFCIPLIFYSLLFLLLLRRVRVFLRSKLKIVVFRLWKFRVKWNFGIRFFCRTTGREKCLFFYQRSTVCGMAMCALYCAAHTVARGSEQAADSFSVQTLQLTLGKSFRSMTISIRLGTHLRGNDNKTNEGRP